MKQKDLMNDPRWIATETIVMKKKHYFLEGSEESLCEKIFNTSKKVKGDNIVYCDVCKKILLKNTSIKIEPVQIKVNLEVAF